MRATEVNGKIEIQAGRWHVAVAENEAHSFRCVLARRLMDLIPEGMAGNKPGLEQFMFDSATEHEPCVSAGWSGRRLWLEFGGLRVEMPQAAALTLWKALDAIRPSNRRVRRPESSEPVLDFDNLDEEHFKLLSGGL